MLALVLLPIIALSLGAINALIPLLIVIILIAAAGASMRGYNIFAIFGISTLAGIGSAKGSFQGKNVARSGLPNPRFQRGFKSAAKAVKKGIKDKRAEKKAIQETVKSGDMNALAKTKIGKSTFGKKHFSEKQMLEANLPFSNSFKEMKAGHDKILAPWQPGYVPVKVTAPAGASRRVRLATRFYNTKIGGRYLASKTARGKIKQKALNSGASKRPTIEREGLRISVKPSALSQAIRAERSTIGIESLVEARKNLLTKEYNKLESGLKAANKSYINATTAEGRKEALKEGQRAWKEYKKGTSSSILNETIIGTGGIEYNKQRYNYWNAKVAPAGTTSKLRKVAGVVAGAGAIVVGAASGYNFLSNEANKERLARGYTYRGGVQWGSSGAEAGAGASQIQNEQKAAKIQKQSNPNAFKKGEEEEKGKVKREEDAAREKVARDEEAAKKKKLKKDDEKG